MSDPYVGKLTYFRVYSGQLKSGDRVLNTTTGKTERISRILQMHANHREEREEIGAGEIAAGVGPEEHDDRRHALDGDGADRARVDDLPGPGDLGRRRAEDEGRPGQARPGPAAPRGGGPDVPRPHRRGDRPDADRRHGRAPPRDHRRPPEARVQRRRERRPAAGRVPRDGAQAGREDQREVRPPDRRPRAVRPRRDQPRARRAGLRLRVRRQDRRREDPEGVHRAGRPRHPGGDGVRASSAATPSSTSASSSSTARTTTSTRARSRSRSRARWPSRRR